MQSLSIAVQPSQSSEPRYLKPLLLAFAVFGAARIIAYLPNIWSICAAADSGQHSLLTWTPGSAPTSRWRRC